jgi:uncharacterized membrane protein YecN with MAPEG domain
MNLLSENPRAWPLVWLLAQIGLSLAISMLLAALYRKFSAAAAGGSDTHRSFWLLALSVTIIFLTMRTSIVTGLTLIGALTLVRFRNPIKEPEEIGFILLVIACSLTVTVWRLEVLGTVLIIASIVLAVQTLRPGVFTGSARAGLIILTLPSSQYAQGGPSLTRVLEKRLYRGALEGFTENDGEIVMSYTFGGLPQASFEDLRNDLLDQAPGLKLNVVFHRTNST